MNGAQAGNGGFCLVSSDLEVLPVKQAVLAGQAVSFKEPFGGIGSLSMGRNRVTRIGATKRLFYGVGLRLILKYLGFKVVNLKVDKAAGCGGLPRSTLCVV